MSRVCKDCGGEGYWQKTEFPDGLGAKVKITTEACLACGGTGLTGSLREWEQAARRSREQMAREREERRRRFLERRS